MRQLVNPNNFLGSLLSFQTIHQSLVQKEMRQSIIIRWRAIIRFSFVTHHLFPDIFEAWPTLWFCCSTFTKTTISIFKKTFFRNEIDWIGLFILFPLNTEHVKVTRSNKKFHYLQRFCGIFEIFLTILKPKCLEVTLFIIRLILVHLFSWPIFGAEALINLNLWTCSFWSFSF